MDGPSAAGKGTIAAKLAKHFGFGFLDTGSLYRSVALLIMEKGGNPADAKEAEKAALSLKKENLYELAANPSIREERVSSAASIVSAIPEVRAALFNVQRDFAENPYLQDRNPAKGAVLDGRDIGNHICPNAEVKLFITADTKIRAERRYKELLSKGFSVIYDDVLADMEARDLRDKTRAVNPLIPAEDAYILDTSALNIDSAAAAALMYAESRIES